MKKSSATMLVVLSTTFIGFNAHAIYSGYYFEEFKNGFYWRFCEPSEPPSYKHTWIGWPDYVGSAARDANGFAASGNITIPSSFKKGSTTIPVDGMWGSAFNGHTRLESINIPDSITFISTAAFGGCTSLTNVTIGSGVKQINVNAFTNCSKLAHISIPTNVSYVYTGAFRNCKKLGAVDFIGEVPSGITDSCILDYATNVRYRRRYADMYADVVPANKFGGYLVFDDDEFLNIVGHPFDKGGVAAWIGDRNVSHDGEGAMRSGTVANEQSSWIETKVNGPVRLSFWWKASSEEYDGEVFDYAYLSVDGEPQGTLNDYQLEGVAIGGKTGWTNVVYDIMQAGEHTVRWTYTKDEVDESDVGEDCVWLDEVSLDPLVSLSFGLNGGEGTAPTPINAFARSRVVLPTTAGFHKPRYTFVGWNDGVETYAGGTRYVVASSNVTFTAVWRANTLSAPIITSEDVSDGGVLQSASARILITAENGSAIHYTLDGSDPTAASALYTEPFYADGLSVAVRAIAIRNDYFDSAVTAFSFRRQPASIADGINASGRTVSTNGVAGWSCVFGNVAHDGVAALRSGAIGDSETSIVEMTVVGSGEIGFWWKSSSEISRNRKYDYVSFLIDGEEASWLGGETDWTNETFSVTGEGPHTFSWVYQKNDNGKTQGEDCAWLDEVTWTSSDPLPDVTGDAEVGAVLTSAGDEVRLKAKLATATTYRQFRTWVDGRNLEHAAVKASLNAWFSYALDAPGLMAKSTPLTSEDVVIDSFVPSDAISRAFDIVVDIAGAEIGSAAQLAEMLEVEGATELNESTFSSNGLTFTLQRTADGKSKATITPAGSPSTFFMRVKVK